VLADHGQVALHARQDVLGLQRLLRVLVVAQLVVDAPDVVGLAVHQQRRAGIGRRVEPGQPLHRPPRLLHDVDDDVAAFVLRAFELQPELLAHRAAAAVAGHQPVRPAPRAAVGPSTSHGDAVPVLLHPSTRVDQATCASGTRCSASCTNRSTWYCWMLTMGAKRCVGSLGISKRSTSRSRQKLRPPVHGSALAAQRRRRAGPAQDLLRAARDADRAAAGAIALVGFDHQAAMPWRASSAASVRPTGPPPAMATGWRRASVRPSSGGMRAGYCLPANG
jgi:hypothetical protein